MYLTLGWGLGLRFPVYHPESTIVRRAPALTLYERMFLSLSPHTCTLCSMFFPDPSVVGLVPPCTCWRKYTITRLCASHICVTWSAKSLSFFPSCTSSFFELGIEVAFNHRSAVTHKKVNLLKIPLRSSSFERTDDTFVLLFCFCFFHL